MIALTELLARVEKATGADVELGEYVLLATGHRFSIAFLSDTGWKFRGVSLTEREVDITASLDAALALVERVLPGWGADIELGDPTRGPIELRKPCVELKPHMTNDRGWAVGRNARAPTRAATLPLALIATLLKAKIAQAASPTQSFGPTAQSK